MIHTLQGRQRRELPQAPWEIQEEVELYARETGRHAKVYFVPGGGWVVRFSLRSNDKRMILFQQGMAPEPPTEDVWLHKPKGGGRPMDFEPLDIHLMGPSGVREFLERGNMWSGRGEFSSLEEQLRNVRNKNEESRERHRANQKEENRHEQRDKRRHRFKLPFFPVGIDLKKRPEKGGEPK